MVCLEVTSCKMGAKGADVVGSCPENLAGAGLETKHEPDWEWRSSNFGGGAFGTSWPEVQQHRG